MCADGGANILYDMSGHGGESHCALRDIICLNLLTLSHLRSALKPDAIKGDLDSIRSDVKSHYEVRSEATSLVYGARQRSSKLGTTSQ